MNYVSTFNVIVHDACWKHSFRTGQTKLQKNKLDEFKIDMRLSVFEPLNERGIIKTHKQLATKTDLIKSTTFNNKIVVSMLWICRLNT